LVWILKYGKTEETQKGREETRGRHDADLMGELYWDGNKEIAFQAIKQATANNAMASGNPNTQYHMAVDPSKKGI